MGEQIFYIVMKDVPDTHISKRHEKAELAQMEAERLCKKHQHRYYVLAAVGHVEPKQAPVQWEVYKTEDES